MLKFHKMVLLIFDFSYFQLSIHNYLNSFIFEQVIFKLIDMIQRIQSLYLLLTSLLSVLFLSGSFLTFLDNSGNEITVNFNGIWQSATEGNDTLIGHQIVLSVLIILISLMSFAAIFFYKNRKFQMKLTIAVIFLTAASVAALVFYSISIISKYNAEIIPGVKMFIPLLILIFGILAYRGIKRDENLVKSYDRLR